MSGQNDQEYFAARARVERERSDTCKDPAAALIHAQLAERYEKLAVGFIEPRPRLTIRGRR